MPQVVGAACACDIWQIKEGGENTATGRAGSRVTDLAGEKDQSGTQGGFGAYLMASLPKRDAIKCPFVPDVLLRPPGLENSPFRDNSDYVLV